MSQTINKAAFQKLRTRGFERVWIDTPEWASVGIDGLYVRGMTVREKTHVFGIGADTNKAESTRSIEASLEAVLACAVDETGEQVMDEMVLAHLTNLSLEPVGRMFEAIMRRSGMNEAADGDDAGKA